MKYNILLYGGSFNPIHNGHLITARYVGEKLGVGRVAFIPSAHHPFNKKNIIEFNHRFNMVVAAIGDQVLFDVSACEQDRAGPSYSIDTVRRFRKCLGNSVDKIYWLIGQDLLPQLADWHGIEDLSNEATIITASRPGYSLRDINKQWLTDGDFHKPLKKDFNTTSVLSNIMVTPQIEISSTEIRERVKNGLSIKYMVPESVDKYIEEHNLYKK